MHAMLGKVNNIFVHLMCNVPVLLENRVFMDAKFCRCRGFEARGLKLRSSWNADQLPSDRGVHECDHRAAAVVAEARGADI